MKGCLTGIILLTLTLLVGILGTSWNTNSFGYFQQDISMLDYIPPSYIGIIYVPEATLLTQKMEDTEQWKDLQNLSFVQKLSDLVGSIESICAHIKERGESAQLFSFVASLHLTSPQDYDYLLHAKAIDISFWKLSKWMEKLESYGYEIQSHYFNGATIYEVKGNDLEKPLAFAQYGKTVWCSYFSTLIEEAINEQTDDLRLIFKEYNREKDKIATYFNFENASFLNTVFFKEDAQAFNQLKKWGKGIYNEWNIQEGRFEMTGHIVLDEDSNILKRSQALPNNTLAQYVPYNSPFFIQQKNKEINLETSTRKATFKKYFQPWFENDWGMFIPEFQSKELESCLLLKSKDVKRASNLLKLLAKKSPKEVQRIKYRDFEIRPLHNNQIVNILLGEDWTEVYKEPHFTTIENQVLIGSNLHATQNALDQYLNKNALSGQADFQNFYNKSVEQEGIFTYVQPRFLIQLLSKNPSDAFKKSLDKYKNSYTTFSPIQINVKADGRLEGQLTHNFQEGEQSAMAWNVALDAPPLGKPIIIENNDKNQILVQDEKYDLYCLSNDGQILWRTSVDGPILGKVHVVDYYKNKETQLLFNTPKTIQVLDITEGKSIENFPLKLSSKATAGMLLTHFLGERQIFIPCKNEKVYAYEQNGKLMQGWNPKTGLGLIKQPLQCLKQDKNIYIIAANAAGTISFLTPRGNLEFISSLESPLVSPFQIDMRDSLKVVVATCANGKTYTINQEGISWSKNYIPIDSTGLFMSENILASDAKEMVFAHKNKVAIFNTTEKLMEYDLPCSASEIFTNSFSDLDTKRAGVFCAENEQIYLLDYDKIRDGFPMKASTPFVITDLFGNNENMLVAGGTEQNVFAYRLK